MQSAVEQRLRSHFGQEGAGIAAVYLFGSVAKGTARADSDVDVAVLFQQTPPRTLAGLHLDLAAKLETELGRRVDLVVLNHAPVDLIHEVMRDGILVAERDPGARVRFEVKARNEYFDLLPYLMAYRGLSKAPA